MTIAVPIASDRQIAYPSAKLKSGKFFSISNSTDREPVFVSVEMILTCTIDTDANPFSL